MPASRLEDLTPRPGERWKEWFKRFAQWARQFTLFRGDPRVRFNVIPGHGTWVTADIEQPGYVGSWAVSLSGMEATVGEGYVNNLIATVDGVGLDGKKKDGTSTTVPSISLSDGPNAKLRSWLCVQTEIDPKTFKLLNPEEHKDVITIVHVNELDPAHRDGGSPDLNHLGREPIAVIKWQDKATPLGVWQHANSDLHHWFKPGTKGARGRHFFY